ncbi:FHAB-like protein [Mya arenaria]|uniref:FHAB-like protein n=1 Tax=Mya arenaria TaxID=6604 RepID=A0ABY7E6E7_MYAAR|nr:FHAB-like protein [Mya arenaria]
MTFPRPDAGLQSYVKFDEMQNEEHHLGPSQFQQLPIGMVSQFSNDFMYPVCLGVAKRMMWLWMKDPLVNSCRISAGTLKQISDTLTDLHSYLPREFNQKGHPLNAVDRPVVLKNILPVRICRHFFLLFVSIYCLSCKIVFECYTEYANQLLCRFVRQFNELYGVDMLVYNVHGLVHLGKDVEKFGPLDIFSAFIFESFLGNPLLSTDLRISTVSDLGEYLHVASFLGIICKCVLLPCSDGPNTTVASPHQERPRESALPTPPIRPNTTVVSPYPARRSKSAPPTSPISLNTTVASPDPERPSKSASHTPIRPNRTAASPHPKRPSKSALPTPPIRPNTTVTSPHPEPPNKYALPTPPIRPNTTVASPHPERPSKSALPTPPVRPNTTVASPHPERPSKSSLPTPPIRPNTTVASAHPERPSKSSLPTPPIRPNRTAASPHPERPSKSASYTPIRPNTTVASPHPERLSRSASLTPIIPNTTLASPHPERPNRSASLTLIIPNTTVTSPHPERPSRSASLTPIRLNTTVASPRPD